MAVSCMSGLCWPRAMRTTISRARGESLWLRTNSARSRSFDELPLPVRNFSRRGSARSESVLSSPFRAMSLRSSSPSVSGDVRWPERWRISISRARASFSHLLCGADLRSWAMVASASAAPPPALLARLGLLRRRTVGDLEEDALQLVDDARHARFPGAPRAQSEEPVRGHQVLRRLLRRAHVHRLLALRVGDLQQHHLRP